MLGRSLFFTPKQDFGPRTAKSQPIWIICLPILLYGFECYLLNKADTRSLDFAVTRFLMKTFRTVEMDVINECRLYFDFMLL